MVPRNNIQVESKNLFAPADFHLSIADIILRQLHSHELWSRSKA